MKNNESLHLKKDLNNDYISIDLINLTIYNLSIKNNEFHQILNSFYPGKNQIFNLNSNFDNFLLNLSKQKIISRKFNRHFEYINKIITSERIIKYKKSITPQNKIISDISKLIIYLIKNNINTRKHSLNEKIFKILILMMYWEIFPIKNFILILDIFLNAATNKINQEKKNIDSPSSFNSSALYFINNLFEALTNIPRKLINDNIHKHLIDELIQILDQTIFSFSLYLELNKMPIWFKLLRNKIINTDTKQPLFYNKLISFLVKIYKYNYQNSYYYKYFYEQSAISFDYFINSLDFLLALFKEEEKSRISNDFKIKSGFYIYNNIPLSLNNIKFKLNSFSMIFSFNLSKICNDNEDIVLLNLGNYEQENNILRIIINKEKRILKIVDGKNNEWNTNISINLNKDYLICLSQESKMFEKKLDLYINDNNNRFNYYSSKNLGFPAFYQSLTLDLGKSNFEGLFGEFLIINKKIKSEDIYHLYKLEGNYADIISTIDYKNDFTYKKYKSTNEDYIFFKNLKFQCIVKILTSQFNTILNDYKSIKLDPYGELKYTKYIANEDNNELKIKLFRIIDAKENFFNEHGLEYLIFQLHRIISLSENNEMLNYYLYKTLYFVLEYIKLASKYIFPIKDMKVKTEKKYTNIILSLITILNTKKRKFQLDEKIMEILLSFSQTYREKKAAAISQKINFSILLDRKIFKKMKLSIYEKLFDEIILYLKNEEKENSLLYKELFCKYLLLDDILESKEIKEIHYNKYMSIISYFIIGNKNNKIKDINSMKKLFINYITNIKNQKKLYFYLKLIYLNFDQIKLYFQENEKFVKFIIANVNPLNNNNEYSEYIQILCFLLTKIISKNKALPTEQNKYKIKNINYKFIKCLFIKDFKVNNRIKLSFIESSSHFDNEMDILCSIYKQKNLNILSLIDQTNFVYKLNSIITYYYYIYNEYLLHKSKKIEILLKRGIKLVFDFIDVISNMKEIKSLELYNNISDDNIIQNKDNKESQIKKKNKNSYIHKFINDLFISSGIKILFVLYFSIYEENDLKNMKYLIKYINISICNIYNPFYFYLLLSKIFLKNNVQISNYYRTEILNIIINNIILINSNYIKDRIQANKILAMNSIIVLIRIYHLVINDSLFLSSQLQKNIINYLKYIFENYYIYSKVLFDINSSDENIIDVEDLKLSKRKENKYKINNIEKKPKEHKLLLEIVLDVIFHLLEKKENNELFSFLNYNLKLHENNNIFFKIDEFSFVEINNNINQNYKNNMVYLLNSQKIISKFCTGINNNNIISSFYFLIYFINKETIFLSKFGGNKEKQNEIISFINKILENLFKSAQNTIKINQKKIKKIKHKISSNEIILKSYDIIYEHFMSKNKDNYLNISEGKDIYQYYYNLLQTSHIADNIEKNNEKKENKLSLLEKKELNSLNIYKNNSKRKSAFYPNEFSLKEDNFNKDENTKSIDFKKYISFEEKNNNIIDNKKERSSVENDFGRSESSLTDITFTNNNNESSSESESDNSSDEDINRSNPNNDNEKPPLNIIIEKDVTLKKINKINEDEFSLNNNIIIDENNLENIENEHKYLNDKLDAINVPSLYYKKLMLKNDPRWVRIVLKPKRTFFKIFGISFKKYIFNSRRFNKLKYAFKINFKNVELEKSIPEEENYCLKYPSKLKNFICNDYYKPFLYPILDFFENDYFIKCHPFIKNDIYKKDITDEDKFSKINYEKLILDKKSKHNPELKRGTRCEYISCKGSIFGSIYFFHSLMIFRDHSNKDERLSDDIPEKEKIFFLFSSDISDRLQNLDKYIVIFYNEIKEIILRKYCFNEIAYEIFMKDGRSYFFNFFSKKNGGKFYYNLITKIHLLNEKTKKKNDIGIYKRYKYDDNYVNAIIIDEPKSFFEKNEYRSKYSRNEITNFHYLLLVNKFSCRSYNECNQYLIFPLLYMDIDKKLERDLSKPICLNKELNEGNYLKYKSNYETMGYHFNNHYSTMAYILYYLMRIIPFTYAQIKLQSGRFDAPSRMFTSLENLLFVFNVSDENRELIPEFFYSFESFLNLNYNDFGYSKVDNIQINNFNNNQNCGIIEFIIDLRKRLEKKELSPWINNIFGVNQLSENYNSFNKFPDYSYEQYNNFNSEKESLFSEIEDKMNDNKKKKINDKINDMRARIQLLSLGLTPSQLFKYPHPSKDKNPKKNSINLFENNNDIKNKKPRKKSSINNNLNDFIQNTSFKDLEYIFDNNDNKTLKIIFIFTNIVTIFHITLETQLKNIPLEDDLRILKMKPYNNCFIELYDNTYLFCRLNNRTLLLSHGDEKFLIEWPCIATAIALYSHEEVYSNFNIEIHINKIIIGDEQGNLALIGIETECNEKKKELKIISLNSIQKRFKIFSSYINAILYIKRLNVIISSCNEGYISINNSFSFEIINIIQIENNINIIDFKLSEYDLLYIFTNNFVNGESKYCLYLYTINGIKIKELSSKNEYINFFINNDRINAFCNDGNIYEYSCSNLKERESIIGKEDLDDIKSKGEILYCLECSESKNIYIIFNKNLKVINTNKEM